MAEATSSTSDSTDNLADKRLANLRPWKPGQSGNPKGRSKEQGEVERLAKDKSKRALERIIELVESDDERIALMAAKEVLDRAFGKAKQVESDDDDDKRSLTINIVRYSDHQNASDLTHVNVKSFTEAEISDARKISN